MELAGKSNSPEYQNLQKRLQLLEKQDAQVIKKSFNSNQDTSVFNKFNVEKNTGIIKKTFNSEDTTSEIDKTFKLDIQG